MVIERALSALTSLGATWVLWLLAMLSLVAVAVAVERALYLWSSRDDVSELARELNVLLERNDVGRAIQRLTESPSFEAKIAAATLEAKTSAGAEERMVAESLRSRLSMERHLAFLGTLGNNGPFVGLLGTVIGVIRAFAELEASAGQVSSGLMAEVGEALVATAVGLLVALPAVAAFNAFQRIIRARLSQGEVLAREVLAYVKAQSPAGES